MIIDDYELAWEDEVRVKQVLCNNYREKECFNCPNCAHFRYVKK